MRTVTVALVSLLLAATLTACEGSPTGPTVEPQVDPGRIPSGSLTTSRFSPTARSVVPTPCRFKKPYGTRGGCRAV